MLLPHATTTHMSTRLSSGLVSFTNSTMGGHESASRLPAPVMTSEPSPLVSRFSGVGPPSFQVGCHSGMSPVRWRLPCAWLAHHTPRDHAHPSTVIRARALPPPRCTTTHDDGPCHAPLPRQRRALDEQALEGLGHHGPHKVLLPRQLAVCLGHTNAAPIWLLPARALQPQLNDGVEAVVRDGGKLVEGHLGDALVRDNGLLSRAHTTTAPTPGHVSSPDATNRATA